MRDVDRDALDRLGYVVLARVLDAAFVARLLRAFDAAPPQASGTQHVAIDASTPEHASWLALRGHDVLASAAAHVLGRAFPVSELHGRNPLPGHGQQGLHADAAPRAPGEAFSVVTTLVMLDDFTVENGATRVVPGTHRLPGAVPRELAQPSARHPDERIVTGSAGSMLVLNGHVWHSGRRNESAGPRRAVQVVIRTHASSSM